MRRLAVLGKPVAHSRSPAMHNAALAELGLGGEWSYEAIEVSPEGFAELVGALPRRGFVGVNVTVPHKRAALELAHRASAAATEIGAANTLSFADGIVAENTDAAGVLESLPASPAGCRALVLGAGGAARAAVWALAGAGAEVSIWNRTPERARRLADELGAVAIASTGDRPLGTESFDLILNATTVGLPGSGQAVPERGSDLKRLPIDADCLSERQIVVDLVYGPVETELAAAARAAGATVVDGIEVLVRQGAASLKLWTGIEAPLETMREAARG